MKVCVLCILLALAACAQPEPFKPGTPIATPEACKDVIERGGRC